MAPKPTVFIVDDDEAVRRFLGALIESIGLRVEIYASAQEFLDTPMPGPPGCILLDIRMPGMSGLEVQKELNRRHSRLPVIILIMAVVAVTSSGVELKDWHRRWISTERDRWH